MSNNFAKTITWAKLIYAVSSADKFQIMENPVNYSFTNSKSSIYKNFTLSWLLISTFHRHSTDRLDTTLSTLLNCTSNSPSAKTNKKGFNLPAILFIIYLIILIGLFIAVIALKKRRRKRSGYQHKGCKCFWSFCWLKIC